MARLRARLERERVRRRRRYAALAVATSGVCAAILTTILVSPIRGTDPTQAPVASILDLDPSAYSAMATLGVAAPPSEPVTVPPADRGQIAVRRVPTRDPSVVFYLVGTVAPLTNGM